MNSPTYTRPTRIRVAPFLSLALLALLFAFMVTSEASAKSPPQTAGLLFVQEADGGQLERVSKDRYKLTVRAAAPRIATFTDRPRRQAGRLGLRNFVRSWRSYGFAADPPNAALVLDHAPKRSDVAMLTLSQPAYDARRQRLTFLVRPLRGQSSTGALLRLSRRGDRVHSMRFGAASLFIDDASTGPVYTKVDVTVIGLQPGNGASLTVSGPQGVNIAWSSGPPFGSDRTFPPSEGIVIDASGEVSLSGFVISGSVLSVEATLSGPPHYTTQPYSSLFQISLYLVSDGPLPQYSLRVQGEAGFQVEIDEEVLP